MRKRKVRNTHGSENVDRWLVSYADFITLMFAFFVVMYSISQVNENKYKVFSSSVVDAFQNGNMALQVTPPAGSANTNVALPPKPIATDIQMQKRLEAEQTKLRQTGQQISQALAPMLADEQVSIRMDDSGVHVSIKDSALFAQAQATPSVQSIEAMSKLAKIIQKIDNPVRVEGFTDNLPIKTSVYPSNWELSAARAASIVRLFQESGINSSRLAAIGRADTRPVSQNDTEEGRAQNRRVTITIVSNYANSNVAP